jgi:hypothetical protein
VWPIAANDEHHMTRLNILAADDCGLEVIIPLLLSVTETLFPPFPAH